MNFRWKIAQAAEMRWWKTYLKKKPVADYLQNKKAYWHRVLKLADVHIKDSDLVLDAGCGPAGIFIILNNNTVDAIGPTDSVVPVTELVVGIYGKNRSRRPWDLALSNGSVVIKDRTQKHHHQVALAASRPPEHTDMMGKGVHGEINGHAS